MQWPAKTAGFLEDLMAQMKSRGINSAVEIGDISWGISEPTAAALSQSVMSDAAPLRYTATPSHSIIIRVLMHIYGKRAPEPFEVLWCDKATTPQTVRAFLERAKHHPRRTQISPIARFECG